MQKKIAVIGANMLMAQGFQRTLEQMQPPPIIFGLWNSPLELVSARLPQPPDLVVILTDEVDEQVETQWTVLRSALGPTPSFLLIAPMLYSAQLSKLQKLGLRGLLKSSAVQETINATISLLPHHTVIDTSIVVPSSLATGNLTTQEKKIALMLSQGLSVKEIATSLNLSIKTIEAHKFNLMRKLDIHNKADLVRWVMANLETDQATSD
jgi:DNA-binding NarL/FixJ family response regulator